MIILLFLTIIRNLTRLLEDNYSNKLITSSMRASVLSATSFLRNGLFGGWLIIWIYGVLIDDIGIGYVLLISSIILLISGFCMIILRKNKNTIK